MPLWSPTVQERGVSQKCINLCNFLIKQNLLISIFLYFSGVAGMCCKYLSSGVVFVTFLINFWILPTAKTTVAPLDRIKILLQAHSVHYKHLGVFSGLANIVKRESFLALYKGNGAQMVRIFPYAATQFTAFEIYKKVNMTICRYRN